MSYFASLYCKYSVAYLYSHDSSAFLLFGEASEGLMHFQYDVMIS